MSTIETAGAMRPGTANTPLDSRSVVSSVDDIMNIELPYRGMLVYCSGDGKFYQITALQSAQIGALTVADAKVAAYQEFAAQGEDGKSAYQLAVDNGYEGTVKEWLESLKGETLENFVHTAEAAANGAIELPGAAFPVAVYTSSGKCYPVEKGSLSKSDSGWCIDIAAYLAYDNSSSFSAPWFVYCAGGIKGDPGWNFDPDARGLISERAAYDEEQKGFAFLAIDEGNMYFKLSGDPGDWSSAVLFRGEKGDTGDKGDKGDRGEKGDQGDKGDKGDTGSLTVEVSATVPLSPVEGMVWIYEA